MQNAELRGQLEVTNSNLANLTQRLNDPEYMRSLAAGYDTEDDDPEPQFEELDAENMSTGEVIKEMERRRIESLAWQRRQTEKRFAAKDQSEAANREAQSREQEAQAIRDFVNKTPDFEEHKKEVKELYGKPLNVEEAYELAKLRKIANEAKNGTPHPRHQAMRSDRSAENDTMNKAFDSVEDGAKAAFDEVLGGSDVPI